MSFHKGLTLFKSMQRMTSTLSDRCAEKGIKSSHIFSLKLTTPRHFRTRIEHGGGGIETDSFWIETDSLRIETGSLRIESGSHRIKTHGVWIKAHCVWIKTHSIGIEVGDRNRQLIVPGAAIHGSKMNDSQSNSSIWAILSA